MINRHASLVKQKKMGKTITNHENNTRKRQFTALYLAFIAFNGTIILPFLVWAINTPVAIICCIYYFVFATYKYYNYAKVNKGNTEND